MPKFSANLGFLWTELGLPEAIVAAHQAGFDAVECHFPYAFPAEQLAAVLRDTGLPMLSLNTALGQNGTEDFGTLALPGRENEARELIVQAVDYAALINCPNIHCLAGRSGGTAEAETVYRNNLAFAAELAASKNQTILIEAINQQDVPGYHLSFIEQGIETIESVGAANLKLMFDCYHVQIMQGDLLERFKNALPFIGHVQFASVPDRQEPDHGEVNYPWLFGQMARAGWSGYFGAEYRPAQTTEAGLGWLNHIKTG